MLIYQYCNIPVYLYINMRLDQHIPIYKHIYYILLYKHANKNTIRRHSYIDIY